MKTGKLNDSVACVRGRWGEDLAARYLAGRGYRIIDRNARPLKRDARLELDIVAEEKRTGTVVFVEVKQHARRTPFDPLLRSVDARKRRLVLQAARAWIARHGGESPKYRFDVVEIYGEPDSAARPEIDHVERVRLFSAPGRFVNWYD